MKLAPLIQLLRGNQTVYSFHELQLLWPGISSNTIRARIHYYIEHGELYAIRRGLYAKDANYSRLECASKLWTPSYVSLETVLVKAGAIFQYDQRITVASYQTREIECDHQIYSFRKIHNDILLNHSGIEYQDHSALATKERALLDTLYLNKDYQIDNLSVFDWNQVRKYLLVYKGNQRMQKKVNQLIQTFQEEDGKI